MSFAAAIAVVTWFAIFCVVQTWCLYPLGMILADRMGWFGRTKPKPYVDTLLVSVILPVFNGAGRIREKIQNLLESGYPSECMEIVVISDGSTDETVEIVRGMRSQGVRLIESGGRLGKSGVQNLGIEASTHPYVLFTDLDANLAPGAVHELMAEFSDSRVGCVGATVVYRDDGYESSSSHGLYWKIEQRLKIAQSRAGVLVSLCGSAFAARREVLRKLDTDTGDDFIIPLDAVIAGYENRLSISAVAYDCWPSTDHASELRARRRITMRNFLGLSRRIRRISVSARPGTVFGLVSHKILRWLSPVFLLMALGGSMAYATVSVLGVVLLVGQSIMYVAALTGLAFSLRGRHAAVLSALGAFVWSNVGLFLGLVSLVRRQRVVAYRHSASE